jgi:hypothetical protein
MTKKTFYLHIKDSIVIAYNSHESDSKNLPRGEKFTAVETNNPHDYLGLNEKQIAMDPLPVVTPVESKNINSVRYELKKLYNEIQFRNKIREDVNQLEAEFNTKLVEYNNLKAV